MIERELHDYSNSSLSNEEIFKKWGVTDLDQFKGDIKDIPSAELYKILKFFDDRIESGLSEKVKQYSIGKTLAIIMVLEWIDFTLDTGAKEEDLIYIRLSPVWNQINNLCNAYLDKLGINPKYKTSILTCFANEMPLVFVEGIFGRYDFYCEQNNIKNEFSTVNYELLEYWDNMNFVSLFKKVNSN